jgi:23S rRNA pseudouridine1911/1915/1917 synthase
VIERWRVADEGQRLDREISSKLECSRSRARELLEIGAVRVDERVVREKGLRLAAGQEVSVDEVPEALDRLAGSEAPLVVLGEGPGWVAVDKPAGLAVHPLRVSERDSLLQRVFARYARVDGVGEGGLRSGVVHRLDVDTSGVQIFALDAPAFDRLREAFRRHRIEKVYRALVKGTCPEHGSIELDLEVGRHRPARVRARTAGSGGPASRLCPLRWVRREILRDASLVEVRPSTGFLHQIRASFAWLTHPLLGDAIYGDGRGAPRHMLHASRLSFEEIEVESPDAADFERVLRTLRA